jgi:hypothetical protein
MINIIRKRKTPNFDLAAVESKDQLNDCHKIVVKYDICKHEAYKVEHCKHNRTNISYAQRKSIFTVSIE